MTDRGSSDSDKLSEFLVSGEAGDVILDQEEATHVYFVREGELEIVKPGAEGAAAARSCGPGEFFGESCLGSGAAGELTVRARSNYQLLVLPPASLAQVISENPRIALEMLARRAGRTDSPGASEVVPSIHATGPVEAPTREGERSPDPPPATDAGERQDVPYQAWLRLGDAEVELSLPDEGEARVGRPDPEAGFQPEVDLSPFDEHRSASRRHARILAKHGSYTLLEESGVTNGTFVNGERVPAETPIELTDGDEISFARVRVVFFHRSAQAD